MASPTGRPIRGELLDVAETLIRRSGVNGFSYRDLAAELGITAPSIHHHFPAKDDLVAEVAERYRHRFAERAASAEGSSAERLRAYASLFSTAGDDGLMCLCAVMVSDWAGVGERSQSAVSGFFDDQRAWLRACVADGVVSGEFRDDVDVSAIADSLLAALEGALLMVRASGDTRAPSTVMSALTVMLTGATRS